MMKNLFRLATMLLTLTLAPSAVAADTRRNLLGMEFVFVPPGEFRMGTSPDDAQLITLEMDAPDDSLFRDEAPVHRVQLSHGFWLGRTEVTQEQWLQVMHNRPGPEDHWQRADWETLPVVAVSWTMAQQFVAALSRIDARYKYRLPTEAEWEYSARAGADGTRPMPPEQLGEYAWFIGNSADVPHPVGGRKPNDFGLYDMLGNAWEWVNDRYRPDAYTAEPRIDPTGPTHGEKRVRRGGSYHCPLHQTRPAYRAADTPDTAYSVLGLRVVAEEQ